MSLHKLTAGDGYTYLTRQVAAHDASERGYDSLGAYYSEKGEAPGVWMGRGLAGASEFPVTGEVTEPQMVALFGEGRHPNAELIEASARAVGASEWSIDRASRLGSPYPIHNEANEFRRRLAGAYRDFNLAAGAREDSPVPAPERARIRTELASRMFGEEQGRAPADARELSGYLARASRQATTAVAGYDLTFSPVKSVSTLWAIAPIEVARVIEAAHREAVADTLAWLEDNATYTRRGRGGVAQVEVRGLIAAAFTHRDSRAGDPDLHTHVAISNKVQTLDGAWLALDGRMIYRNNVAASERYNTRVEALLRERLGVRFEARPGTDPAKRPVREIAGVDGDLPAAWSSRRVAIETRRAALSAKFQADHGRPPTAKEALALAQQANLETRQHKHEPRAYDEQRQAWRAEATAILGGEPPLDELVDRVLRPDRAKAKEMSARERAVWTQRTADAVLGSVQAARATWQEHHLRAEAERHARQADLPLTELDQAVEGVLGAATSPGRSVVLDTREPVSEPAALRRRDGTSVYRVAGSTLFTSPAILEAEAQILRAAGASGGRTVTQSAVDLALLESVANGVELNPGQAQLVAQLATSGARVQLALAPAGTGKTASMRVLAQAWNNASTESEEAGHVIGLAPSAAAAAVLREEIGADTDTLAKLIHSLNHPDQPAAAWIEAIGPNTLVVIDEAGMAGTIDLAAAIDYATGRGASVRLIGDDQQLASIGAGGVLRDIAATHGAVTLSQVMRFTHRDTGAPNRAEGAASLALRDGDPAAIAYYLDHGRVHVGDLATVTDQAYMAWAADRAAGVDAIMLAPTRELGATLNRRARLDRLARTTGGHQDGTSREVALVDGCHASAGDEIITRQNDRRIPIGARDWVKNGDRWTVQQVHATGALDVTHRRTGRRITLPANYARTHVTLGYATTVHGAQGITADTAYTVAAGNESRQILYVAMTRGRHANHIYLTTAGDGDPHSIITRDALLPPTAGDLLARTLTRDDSPVSATSQAAALDDPALRLHLAGDRYYDAVTVAAEDLLGTAGMHAIDTTVRALAPIAITGSAWPALRAHLALRAAAGEDIEDLLDRALQDGGLGDAKDPAAVLDWRLDPHRASEDGPLPWLPAIPERLRAHPQWGPYLDRRDRLVRDLADHVRAETATWTPSSTPAWATHLVGRDDHLLADLAVWRAANAVEDTDRTPTGPSTLRAADVRAQRQLKQRANTLLDAADHATRTWADLAAAIDPRIPTDPYWPMLAENLTMAARAGIDIASLARIEGDRRPLPDEQPAAALWWRLTEHLGPATLTARASSTDTLRPDWTPALLAELGDDLGHRVLADPAWPSLVAAITVAQHDGWQPDQLLATVHDLLRSGQGPDEPLRPDELTTALAWRVGLLLQHADAQTTPPQDMPMSDVEPAALEDLEPDQATPDDTPWHVHITSAAPSTPAGEPLGIWVGSGEPENQMSEAKIAAALQEWNRWDHAVVSRERILELNQMAADYYGGRYPTSWGPDYLAERLGEDLAAALDPVQAVGYAPTGWTALTNHLRRAGASDEEIVGAGLGTHASTGRVIDRFRDRLMFPIRNGHEIHGFLGRRNPDTDTVQDAPPKYLNTPETDLFHKREALYGLTESANALQQGAGLVLVEGPLDAWAINLASGGEHVGVAPLGTAFTDSQADKLAPYLGPNRPPTIVATDNDPAGQQAARRAYWQLTLHGDNPQRLQLPPGLDPAQLLQTQGPQALRDHLNAPTGLARELVDQQLEELDTAETTPPELATAATKSALAIIAALPVDHSPEELAHLVARTGLDIEQAATDLVNARAAWRADPPAAARAGINAPQTPALSAVTSNGISEDLERWHALADRVQPALTEDPGWPALAAVLQRAHNAGHDVETHFPRLAAEPTLPESGAAQEMEYRIVSEYPEAAVRPRRTHAQASRHVPGDTQPQANRNHPRVIPDRVTPPTRRPL